MVEDGARCIRSIRASFQDTDGDSAGDLRNQSATTRRLLADWAAGTEHAGLMLGIGDSRFQDEGERALERPQGGCQPMSSINVSSVTAIR
jgi:ABC-type nitrate/sulfonate/bicarbonate transport system substrate-binding protein